MGFPLRSPQVALVSSKQRQGDLELHSDDSDLIPLTSLPSSSRTPETLHASSLSRWLFHIFLAIIVHLSAIHQYISVIHNTGLSYHLNYRYHSSPTIPHFRVRIALNIIEILCCFISGRFIFAHLFGERHGAGKRQFWGCLLGLWVIAVPVLVFVLNWARPQPLGVMRTMAAKECGAGGVLTVPHHMGPRVTTGVGKAMYWTVDRRGEMVVDVMKAGVGVEINGTVGMVKTGFERMEGFKLVFDPVATDSTPESPAIANYSFSLIISSPALTTITLRNGTILDACASSPYCPLFPNLTPPIAYDTDDSGKHQKFITNTGLTVARKLGKERGFDKWCVRPSLDDILADQKQMETVLVVAGWIAAEMDMEVKEIQDQA